MITYEKARTNAERIADERLKKRVIAGMELLKEKYGEDWVEHIDPTKLDMGEYFRCILGQLYSGYTKGLAALGIDTSYDEYGNHNGGLPYAFDIENADAYEMLDDAWLTVLGYHDD